METVTVQILVTYKNKTKINEKITIVYNPKFKNKNAIIEIAKQRLKSKIKYAETIYGKVASKGTLNML